jgi:Tfp pilus assembly protein PilN
VRAVNLIPADSRGRSRGPSTGMALPMYVLLGLLAAAVALVTVYVLTGNSISSRQATLTSLKTQVSQEQAIANRLGSFSKFSQLAQTRISTVSSIAAARFDWHGALENLAKVVPADTTLSAINGTVVPGASAGGGGGNALRADITAPAFELTGCTANQDDVARLMSRLRVINGVTRVSFSNSQVANAAAPGAGASTGVSQNGCTASAATFDLTVFFTPVANAGAQGVTSVNGITSTAAGTTPTSGATPTSGTTTTTGGTQ